MNYHIIDIAQLEQMIINSSERRPLDNSRPFGYLESDLDYVNNNLQLAVFMLENADEILAALKKSSA